MMNSGKHPLQFITVEGGEGAGKTSLINSLEEVLLSWGFPVCRTREPGGTILGNQIREWLLSRRAAFHMAYKAELLLFLAARAQHIEEIILPKMQSGQVVICDRFNDSTIAYQGAGRGLGIPWVHDICQKVCGDPKPDLTFYLDVDPKIGLKRTRHSAKENASAGEVDRIEAEELQFHHRVRNAFLEMIQSEPARFHRIDTNQSKKVVREEAIKVLSKRLGRS
jgi:dTMP kinase